MPTKAYIPVGFSIIPGLRNLFKTIPPNHHKTTECPPNVHPMSTVCTPNADRCPPLPTPQDSRADSGAEIGFLELRPPVHRTLGGGQGHPEQGDDKDRRGAPGAPLWRSGAKRATKGAERRGKSR